MTADARVTANPCPDSTSGSVTANDAATSCNGWRDVRLRGRCRDGVLWSAICTGCDSRITFASDDEHDGEPVGRVRPWPHCCACRERWHNSCLICGVCLPVVGAWKGGQRSQRSDMRYCSNRCRQKAYRQRRARQ